MNKLACFLIVIGLFFISSCVDDNKLSPVDIVNTQKDTSLNSVFADYSVQDSVDISNKGSYISISGFGNFLVLPSEDDYQGKELELSEMLIKSPSEHSVDGKSFALELQFVHSDSANGIVIVAVFVTEGKENSEFAKIIPNIPKRNKTNTIINVDFYNLFQQNPAYWTYNGSSTNEPFEDATWYIMQEPIEASADQINKIKRIIGSNDVKQIELGNRIIFEN